MHEVSCKNEDCGKPIPIPHSNLLRKSPFHEATNPDAGCENVACPSCGHVFYYTPQDSRPYYWVAGTPQGPDVRLHVSTIECNCADKTCAALTEIRLPMAVGTSRECVLDHSDTWTIRECYCQKGSRNGHALLALPPREHRDVHFFPPP